MSVGGKRRGYSSCSSCWQKQRRLERDARREDIANMWREGLTITEIAEALGSTTNSIGVEMCRMRDAGWQLTFRHPPVKTREPPSDDAPTAPR